MFKVGDSAYVVTNDSVECWTVNEIRTRKASGVTISFFDCGLDKKFDTAQIGMFVFRSKFAALQQLKRLENY